MHVVHRTVKIESLLSVDPDVPSITNVASITQTSVTVLWSVGQTQVVSAAVVHYRAIDSNQWMTMISATGTSHSVTSLQPGTQYQFYVEITSYGKSSSSQNTTATTGD